MIETLCDSKFLSLRKIVDPENGVNGYEFIHESRCDGKIISILPFRRTENEAHETEIQILLRQEVTPCWIMNKRVLSSITGGFEGGDPRDTAILELKEEAGYIAEKSELISLGTCFGPKCADTVYYLYSINLTNKEKIDASGDGSELEKKAYCEWSQIHDIVNAKDPLASTTLIRLLIHLRLF